MAATLTVPHGVATIRFVTSLLAVLLLAIGLGLAGYCGLLALRRGRAPSAGAAADPPATTPLPQPERLARSQDFASIALAATHERAAAPGPVVQLVIRNLPAAWRTPEAGIGIRHADAADGLTWIPLVRATTRDQDLVLQPTLPRPGTFVFLVAASRTFALHAYLTRHVQAIVHATEVTIDATASHATFVLPAGSRHAGPFRIVRIDDPRWLPMDVATGGLAVAGDRPTRLWLGAGKYELRDPLAADRCQPFAIPAAANLEINANLRAVRAGRP